MEFKITEEKENLLFNRKEIRGFVGSEIVPSRIEILEILSKRFKTPLENIKIKKIAGKFGSKRFDIEANIYLSEQDKDKIEIKKKKEKKPEEKTEKAAEKHEQKQTEASKETIPLPSEKAQ
jgi:ribosomal protein S24E